MYCKKNCSVSSSLTRFFIYWLSNFLHALLISVCSVLVLCSQFSVGRLLCFVSCNMFEKVKSARAAVRSVSAKQTSDCCLVSLVIQTPAILTHRVLKALCRRWKCQDTFKISACLNIFPPVRLFLNDIWAWCIHTYSVFYVCKCTKFFQIEYGTCCLSFWEKHSLFWY